MNRKYQIAIFISFIILGAITQPKEGFGIGSLLNLAGWVGLVVVGIDYFKSKKKG